MRRRVDVHARAAGLEHGAQIGADRTLAVGSGDVKHGRQFSFRMSEGGEQALDPFQHQVDAFGMQREKPLENGVARRGQSAHAEG